MSIRRPIYLFFASMFLYVVAVLFSRHYVETHPISLGSVLVSLLPVLPAVMATMAVVRAIAAMDELQQRVQVTSLAISFAIVGLLTFAYGFLQNVGFPPVSMVWIFPAMIATWGLAMPMVARQYL